MFDRDLEYHAYPELTMAAMRLHCEPALAIYYILREQRYEGYARTIEMIHMDAAAWLGWTPQHTQRVVKAYNGVFWTAERDGRKIWVECLNLATAAQNLGLTSPGPAVVEKRENLWAPDRRSRTWKYVHAYIAAKSKLPPSQAGMRELTGKTERTQRRYQSHWEDRGSQGLAMEEEYSDPAECMRDFERGLETGRYQRYRHEMRMMNVKMVDGRRSRIIGIFRRLPKVYRGEAVPPGTYELPLFAMHMASPVYGRNNLSVHRTG